MFKFLKITILILLTTNINIKPAFSAVSELPQLTETPIVYSRCARTTSTYDLTDDVTVNGEIKSVTRTLKGLDVYDTLPDVTNFFGNFAAPCDLVYRDESGSEKILYDCSSTSTTENACAALDSSVSFDGKTIAFSVFRGTLGNFDTPFAHQILDPEADNANTARLTLPNKELKTTGAHLHTVDVATGAVSSKPFEKGIYDSGTAFLPNGRIAFTSNRDGNTTNIVWRSTGSTIGTRIWSIDRNWKNMDLNSHHSTSQEQHPYVLKNGRVAYSSWQMLGAKPFKHTNGSTGGFTTTGNLFHIYSQYPDGAENFSIYGQHSGDHYPSYFGENHSAAHFITQTSDERIWFADYYRGNNNGFGILVGVIAAPDGQEGKFPDEVSLLSDMYIPDDVINFASWSHNGDSMSKIATPPSITHPSYSDDLVFSGKVSHPAALPDNGLMISWGKGACSTLAGSSILTHLGIPVPPKVSGSGSGVAINLMTTLNLDVPGCDSGIYIATQIPSLHPSDLQMVVDKPEWHEIMARAVVPYSAIHDIEKPVVIAKSNEKVTHPLLEKGTPFGLLGAASITDRETHPKEGIKFAGEHQFNLQGTDTINYTDEDLCGVRILSMMPNRDRNSYYGVANLFGERVRILGEFSTKNKDSEGNDIIDPSGNVDTSFLARMPANSPYLMQGIDCKGRTLNTDITWQSLRPGEQKTCGGCHVHSKESRITFDESFAATDEYTIPRLGDGVIPLLTGKTGNVVNTREVDGFAMSIDFDRDIMPIFESKCNSCHGGASPMAEPALDILGVNRGRIATDATWWCLVGDYGQKCLSESNRVSTENETYFRRPQVSKYVRAFNSLGSLLYWKAANERTDGNTDSTFSDDIDFGADHPTTITEDELGLISRWIDIGVPAGSDELIDTQKPTLHITSTSTGESVSKIKVGTVDIGVGINTESLIVCILDAQNTCTNIATEAHEAGVTVIDLGTTLTDPTTEILVSIQDKQGNVTQVKRTVSFLTNSSNSNITITPINNAELIDKNTFNFFVDISDNNSTPNTIEVIVSDGDITSNEDSSYTLTTPNNFNGEIFIIIIASDNINPSDTDSTSFTLSVIQVNKKPTNIIIENIETQMNEISSVVNVTVVDPDVNDIHTITLSVLPLNGNIVLSGDNLIYNPNTDYIGMDSFTITATDQGGLSIDSIVSVEVTEPKKSGSFGFGLIFLLTFIFYRSKYCK